MRRVKVIAKRPEDAEDATFYVANEVRVVDAETGETIEGVRALDFHVDCENVPLLILEIYSPDVEIEALPEIQHVTPDSSPDHPGLNHKDQLT